MWNIFRKHTGYYRYVMGDEILHTSHPYRKAPKKIKMLTMKGGKDAEGYSGQKLIRKKMQYGEGPRESPLMGVLLFLERLSLSILK